MITVPGDALSQLRVLAIVLVVDLLVGELIDDVVHDSECVLLHGVQSLVVHLNGCADCAGIVHLAVTGLELVTLNGELEILNFLEVSLSRFARMMQSCLCDTVWSL